MIAELARARARRLERAGGALERMRADARDHPAGRVRRRGDDEAARLREVVHGALETVRSMPQILAMVLVQRDLGPRSPWGRFRLAVERFDEVLFELVARRRAGPAATTRCSSLLLEQRDEQGNPPSDRHLRDQLVALLVGGHDSSAASLAWAFERLARHPAVHARLRDGDPAYLDAVVKEVLRARPALTIAPRLLLEPVRIAGHELPAGVQVAACLWLAMRREDLWPHASAFAPERWLEGRLAEPDVVDPVRRRRASLRRRAVRRDGDARGAASAAARSSSARSSEAGARPAQHARRRAEPRRRADRRKGLSAIIGA